MSENKSNEELAIDANRELWFPGGHLTPERTEALFLSFLNEATQSRDAKLLAWLDWAEHKPMCRASAREAIPCSCGLDELRTSGRFGLDLMVLLSEQSKRIRIAWEAGFKLCRSYRDNWFHFRGEQKERQWQKFLNDTTNTTGGGIPDSAGATERPGDTGGSRDIPSNDHRDDNQA